MTKKEDHSKHLVEAATVAGGAAGLAVAGPKKLSSPPPVLRTRQLTTAERRERHPNLRGRLCCIAGKRTRISRRA